MRTIDLNCDLGEGFGNYIAGPDVSLLKHISSCSIACGYHAGDEETMKQVIEISKKNGVSIGAHPSFNDPDNFGRKRMNLSNSEIKKLIIEEIYIINK